VYSRHLNRKINCKAPACTHVLIIIAAFDFLQTLTGTQNACNKSGFNNVVGLFSGRHSKLTSSHHGDGQEHEEHKNILRTASSGDLHFSKMAKNLIPRFTNENHIDCFLNLSIKMSRDQRPTWVVPQLTDKMKNSLKDQIVRKDIWVVGGTVFLVLLLLFQRYWDCL
jgi:hypothetical protein